MITLQGDLVVEKRSGRNGDFNVAKIHTSIGKFSVRYSLLDQFEQGKYEGEFDVSQIRAASFQLGNTGKILIEAVAQIDAIRITGAELGHEELPDPVIDPGTDQACDVQNAKSEKKVATKRKAATSSRDSYADPAGESLFGHLWPLGSVVKLDSTVDRNTLRAQIKYLQDNGWSIDLKEQVFRKQR
ncbi:DUF3275 family protein [Hahella ganghwensis]|uniref:DUF3275 family protein n=1 Tax=Hahella ganghwensis TaxID=286420 RepID=UPI000365EAFF|nr:DUF3275 family protein [Hahella ganghwensis]